MNSAFHVGFSQGHGRMNEMRELTAAMAAEVPPLERAALENCRSGAFSAPPAQLRKFAGCLLE